MRAVANDTKSAMPVYGPDRLSESDLDDLLATCRRCAASTQPSSSRKETYARHRDSCRTHRPAAALPLGAVAHRAAGGAARPRSRSRRSLDGLKPTASRWLTFGGNYANHRYSPLTQITPDNVKRLLPQWTFQTATLGNFETTTLVRDNVLYVTGPQNVAWALDARTGKQIWRYRRELPHGPDRVLRPRQPRLRACSATSCS